MASFMAEDQEVIHLTKVFFYIIAFAMPFMACEVSLAGASARCSSPSRLRRESPSSDRRLLPLAVTARGLPKLCDDATDVTATCDRSRRDMPEPVRSKRPEELPDDGLEDGRSPKDDRGLGEPSSDGDRLDLVLSSRAARSSVGVFGSDRKSVV